MSTPAQAFGIFHEALRDLEGLVASAEFSSWMNPLLSIKGNLLLTGIGKSGYAAQALCAGLRSIGKSAHFMHGTEAAHGDLGVFALEDAAIVYSKSGESVELYPLIDHCKANRIPLFSVTENPRSYLAQSSTHVLILPKIEELSPCTLLPSTSNVVFSSLSELIKLSFIHHLHYTNEAFVRTHPGGRIGAHFKPLDAYLRKGSALPLVRDPECPMREAILEMSEKACGCLVITNEALDVLGMLTDGDLRRALMSHPESVLSSPVSRFMSRNPVTIEPGLSKDEARALMKERDILHLILAENGKLSALLLLKDLLSEGANA